MHGLNIVGLVVVMAAVVVSTAEDPHKKELREHYEHLAYIAEYSCHTPQVRVFSVDELLPEQERTNKAFFPDVTVLNSCDKAVGCCPSSQQCRPKLAHPVKLPFKITFLENVENHKKGSWIIQYYNFYNHTECQCLDPSVCIPAPDQ